MHETLKPSKPEEVKSHQNWFQPDTETFRREDSLFVDLRINK